MTSLRSRVKMNLVKKVINFFGQKFVYDGSSKNNKPDGYGTLKNTNGIIYQGNFKDGKINGKGTFTTTYKEAESFGLNLPDYKIGTTKELLIVGEFKDNQIYANTRFFASDASFALVTSSNEKEFKGWIAENDGTYFSFFDKNKSNLPTESDKQQYKDALEEGFKGSLEDFMEAGEGLIVDDYIKVEDLGLKSQLNHSYIYEYNEYFKNTGWFPNKRFKNKTSFQNTLREWKKKNKLFK